MGRKERKKERKRIRKKESKEENAELAIVDLWEGYCLCLGNSREE